MSGTGSADTRFEFTVFRQNGGALAPAPSFGDRLRQLHADGNNVRHSKGSSSQLDEPSGHFRAVHKVTTLVRNSPVPAERQVRRVQPLANEDESILAGWWQPP